MLPSTANNCVTLQTVRRCFSASLVGQRSRYQRDQLTSGWGIRCLFECSCNDWKVTHTGGALAANPRPLQTHLSCPACIASGNFTLEFPSINSRSRLFSRWRIRARSVEQTTSLARACVNVRIGEFMLGNSRTKLPMQCMLGRRGEFEGVAICNAERCQPCI